jgi:Domain of unknown function (DUF1772)
MFETLQVVAIMLVAVTMAQALAHALEFPGKMRLSKDAYFATQSIYYPGFTIGGFAEIAALLALLLLTILTPQPSARFWLTAGAFVALLLSHAVYWIVTHPVNNFWVSGVQLNSASTRFFALDPFRRGYRAADRDDWTVLRDQWEYSHLLRAGLGLVGLALLAIAVIL